MPDNFVAMMKEEWRVHANVFGSVGFALFPVMLAGFAFMGSFMLPLFLAIMPAAQIALLTHLLFVLLGAMVGSFGIMGREFMNRRFGQASLIAYSSRSLPVSERRIFLNFFVKDVVYYFLLYIIPFVAGFALASPFLAVDPGYLLLLPATLTLSFLMGLSLAFFLSTVYAHSPGLFAGTLAALLIAGAAASRSSVGGVWLLPPFALFLHPSPGPLAASVLIIGICCAVSICFPKIEYQDRTKRFENALDPLTRRLGILRDPHFVAKDALDLKRSEGGIGKIVFSFLLPLGLVWFLLSLLLQFIPAASPLIIFSVLLGVITSTIYNWLTEFDSFSTYAFLPVEVETVMASKLKSYALLNFLPAGLLILVGAGSGEAASLPAAMAVFLAVSSYTLAVTVYLTGLHPNVMLYHAATFFWYLAAISPALLGLIFVSIADPLYAVAGVALIPIAGYLLKKGVLRRDVWDQPGY
ncbi:MAG: hypothetical protein PHV57_09240 [Methanomicrobiaceae archaeon]|nr:hypothetical protein [Methanomicrobiaceae archaeon]